jgi:hypothetical protein
MKVSAMATKTVPVELKSAAAAQAPTAAEPAAKALPARKAKPAAARKRAGAGLPPAPTAAPGKAGKKPVKPRPKLVRDSFTMPEADFALLATLKITALGARRAAKKSELLRAGLQLLATLDAESLVAALNRLETVKTGRPKRGH